MLLTMHASDELRDDCQPRLRRDLIEMLIQYLVDPLFRAVGEPQCDQSERVLQDIRHWLPLAKNDRPNEALDGFIDVGCELVVRLCLFDRLLDWQS